MSDEGKLEKLTDKLVNFMHTLTKFRFQLNEMEKTFSRLQNETENLLEKLLIKQDDKEN